MPLSFRCYPNFAAMNQRIEVKKSTDLKKVDFVGTNYKRLSLNFACNIRQIRDHPFST